MTRHQTALIHGIAMAIVAALGQKGLAQQVTREEVPGIRNLARLETTESPVLELLLDWTEGDEPTPVFSLNLMTRPSSAITNS